MVVGELEVNLDGTWTKRVQEAAVHCGWRCKVMYVDIHLLAAIDLTELGIDTVNQLTVLQMKGK